MCQSKGKRQNPTYLDSENESVSMLPVSKKKKRNNDDSDEDFDFQENGEENGISEYVWFVFFNIGMMIIRIPLLK